LSLLIPDADIRNLYYNGQKIKAAYFNGEKVWTQTHRVEWRLDDDARSLLRTEHVTDGQSAVPPVSQDWTDDYHSYIINGWDAPYSEITADTILTAQSRTTTLYLLRSGYGVNGGFRAEFEGGADGDSFGFGETIAFRDSTSDMKYGSAAYGQISADGIHCAHTGGNSAGTAQTFRSAQYRAALLDADPIRAAGFNRLRFTGSYSFGKGSVYKSANLRVAFVSLQTSATLSTTTSAGVVSGSKWQAKYNANPGTVNTASVSAISGAINGTLDIPESGSFYVIIGELTKAFRGTGEIWIDNMWVE